MDLRRIPEPGTRIRQVRWSSLVVASSCVLAFGACGGGGSGGSGLPPIVPSTDVPASTAEASRFLMQASFGATEPDIELLMENGLTGWIEWQRLIEPTLHRPDVERYGDDANQNHRMERWWWVAMKSPDQLRQRMAFALSQIFVVSDQSGPLQGNPQMCAEYYDVLVRNAFGDYRQLLEEVTLSPAMGRYLSMLGNEKADIALNIRPDENYAREVMQLFTIGLYRLNADGTRELDGDDQPIPTYAQPQIESFARVFTGWTFAGATSWNWPQENYLPMEPWLQYHDTGAKTLLEGHVNAAGLTPRDDLEQALDNLASHPNVGPFIGRQLIQRFVTSNPSPAYVQRVATVFADDGTGARGNLFAVLKAILLDDEARHGHELDPQDFGKLREPILRQTALWRAFEARAPTGRYREWNPESALGQAPLRSPSVFNFYSPFYRPPGEMLDAGLFGPEFQITTHTLITSGTNKISSNVFWGYQGNPNDSADTVEIQIAQEKLLASDPEALVDHLDLLLMAGQMSSWMRSVVVDRISHLSMSDGGEDRVLEAIYLIASSPECAVQR